MSPYYSIIIPVFNGENYISNINYLKNFFNRSFIEIIIINDQSTDNTLYYLNKNFKDISNIKVINNKKNVGLSETRNRGIKISNGEYILFMDIDDKFLLSDLKVLYRKLKKYNSDFYILKYIFLTDRNDYRIVYDEIYNTNLIQYPKLINVFPCWSGIYKRSFLIKNKLEFSKTRKYEDFDFSLRCVTSSKKISVINKDIIEYNKLNSNSMTSNLRNNDSKLFMNHFMRVASTLSKNKYPREILVDKYVFYFSSFINTYGLQLSGISGTCARDFNFLKKKFLDLNLTIDEFYESDKKGILWNYKYPNIVFIYYLFLEYNFQDFSKKVSMRFIPRDDFINFININNNFNNYVHSLIVKDKAKITNNYKLFIDFGNIKTVNLHIGYIKTATSFIQKTILSNHEVLVKNKCLYPKSLMSDDPNNPNHNQFTIIFRENNNELQDHLARNLQKEIKSYPLCENLIISAENLYSFNDSELIDVINFFPDTIKINLFITTRNTAEWLDSSYKERLLSSGFYGSMDNYVESMQRSNVIPFSRKINQISSAIINKKNVSLKKFQYDKNLKFVDNFLNEFLFSVKTKIDKAHIVRGSFSNNFNDYIMLNNFNYLNKHIPFRELKESKEKLLVKIKSNTSSDDKITRFTFLNKEKLSKLFINKKDQVQSEQYLKNKLFINTDLSLLYNFSSIQNNNKVNKSYFFNKWPVGIIQFLLSKRLTYKILFSIYNRFSHLKSMKTILSFYRNNK